MNYKHLDGFNHEAKIVYRSNKPVYKRENVLTTDVIPIAGFSEVTELFPDVFSQHPDAWYLHYEFFDKDTDLIRKRVPSILNAFNRSRVLRREKISGVRVCNIDCTPQPSLQLFMSDFPYSSKLLVRFFGKINITSKYRVTTTALYFIK
ncbi:MAG: hypothetical protein IJ378_03105 [Alistipes sp.]|nr:hypothetical protein [Alistipes sp.]MBQ8450589.1 hypothetical protein [Bacteroidaceae bacterium]